MRRYAVAGRWAPVKGLSPVSWTVCRALLILGWVARTALAEPGPSEVIISNYPGIALADFLYLTCYYGVGLHAVRLSL